MGLAIRRRIGYVSERPALDDWMRVDDIGWYAAGFYPPGFQDRFRQHIGEFGVPIDRRIKQLSKGMRGKVALSLAMSHDPKLLILDEPTSGLDTLIRREFLESMVEFTAEGKTVFLSSHQIHEVERVADIVAIVRHGRLLACEPLDELKETVTEATVTIQGDATIEAPPGVISFDQRGRQGQLFVRANAEQTTQLLHQMPRVEKFDLRRPSLEEIFVAYMKSELTPTPAIVSSDEGVEA